MNGYEVVLKSRTIGHRTEMGTDWPIYVQLLRTTWKIGSCVPKARAIYEVRSFYRETSLGRRQFTTLRAASQHYDEERSRIN